MKRKYLVLVLLLLSLISIFIGAKEINIRNLLNFADEELQILLISRLPRLISILVAGMSMSIAGLIMQQISRNKFVSPTTAATIDSAKLGILVSMIFFSRLGTIGRMLISFVFAIGGTLLFMQILRRVKFKNIVFIPLVGLMLGSIIDSVATFFAYRFDLVQNINTWLQGDFSMIIKGRYELLYISIPLLIIGFVYANKFTIAGMGEDFAVNLGLNYNQIVNIGVGIVAMISSLVIITVGRIPFLGLIIPNIVTIFQGDNMKKNISYTALFGAIFLLFSDILGRLIIYPYEIPISLTVGVIGSAVFLYLLGRGDKYGK
ncbi:MAG: ABC transporter permease [Tissierellaceae bacterium]|nr:ABC transporter permease [Tissierellaceae bacterium]